MLAQINEAKRNRSFPRLIQEGEHIYLRLLDNGRDVKVEISVGDLLNLLIDGAQIARVNYRGEDR